MTPELAANLMCAHCGARPNLMDDLKDELCYNCGLPSEWTDCGCSTSLPPILIEVAEKGPDNMKFSGKVEKDVDMMISELDAAATDSKLYCHVCNSTFASRDRLEAHKNRLAH